MAEWTAALRVVTRAVCWEQPKVVHWELWMAVSKVFPKVEHLAWMRAVQLENQKAEWTAGS